MLFRYIRPALVRHLLIGSLAITLSGPSAPAQSSQNPQDPTEARFVNDLLQKMTFDEKLGQMSQIPLNQPESVSPDERILKGQVGSFLFITDPKEINRLQHIAVEKKPPYPPSLRLRRHPRLPHHFPCPRRWPPRGIPPWPSRPSASPPRRPAPPASTGLSPLWWTSRATPAGAAS